MPGGRRRRTGGDGASRARSRPAKPVKSPGSPPDNLTAGGVPLSEIRRLIRLVQRTGIGELEVSSGGRTVRIAAHSGSAAPMVSEAAAGALAAREATEAG